MSFGVTDLQGGSFFAPVITGVASYLMGKAAADVVHSLGEFGKNSYFASSHSVQVSDDSSSAVAKTNSSNCLLAFGNNVLNVGTTKLTNILYSGICWNGTQPDGASQLRQSGPVGLLLRHQIPLLLQHEETGTYTLFTSRATQDGVHADIGEAFVNTSDVNGVLSVNRPVTLNDVLQNVSFPASLRRFRSGFVAVSKTYVIDRDDDGSGFGGDVSVEYALTIYNTSSGAVNTIQTGSMSEFDDMANLIYAYDVQESPEGASLIYAKKNPDNTSTMYSTSLEEDQVVLASQTFEDAQIGPIKVVTVNDHNYVVFALSNDTANTQNEGYSTWSVRSKPLDQLGDNSTGDVLVNDQYGSVPTFDIANVGSNEAVLCAEDKVGNRSSLYATRYVSCSQVTEGSDGLVNSDDTYTLPKGNVREVLGDEDGVWVVTSGANSVNPTDLKTVVTFLKKTDQLPQQHSGISTSDKVKYGVIGGAAVGGLCGLVQAARSLYHQHRSASVSDKKSLMFNNPLYKDPSDTT